MPPHRLLESEMQPQRRIHCASDNAFGTLYFDCEKSGGETSLGWVLVGVIRKKDEFITSSARSIDPE
jgi:hypothetical protein